MNSRRIHTGRTKSGVAPSQNLALSRARLRRVTAGPCHVPLVIRPNFLSEAFALRISTMKGATMRRSRLPMIILLSVSLSACASWGGDRMFGKYAAMRDIYGNVISTGTSSWGIRYLVMKDIETGLRIYVQSDASTCSPGKAFKATGHLTRATETEYDATFHGHLTDAVCS
jgi:hypothetical protein